MSAFAQGTLAPSAGGQSLCRRTLASLVHPQAEVPCTALGWQQLVI